MLTFLSVAAGNCERNWQYYGGSCYRRLVKSGTNYDSAVRVLFSQRTVSFSIASLSMTMKHFQICDREHNAHLVTIESDAENAFVSSEMAKNDA